MEAVDSFVALSTIYLPDAIATLNYAAKAQTLEAACDRVQEANAVLDCLLRLSQEAASELKALSRPSGEMQEAEAVLKCILRTTGVA